MYREKGVDIENSFPGWRSHKRSGLFIDGEGIEFMLLTVLTKFRVRNVRAAASAMGARAASRASLTHSLIALIL